jgi:D-alanyl-D-alanine dipeptidase
MKLTPEELRNRELLEKVMVKHGFEPFPTEWWHFDFKGWEAYPVMDVPFREVR